MREGWSPLDLDLDLVTRCRTSARHEVTRCRTWRKARGAAHRVKAPRVKVPRRAEELDLFLCRVGLGGHHQEQSRSGRTPKPPVPNPPAARRDRNRWPHRSLRLVRQRWSSTHRDRPRIPRRGGSLHTREERTPRSATHRLNSAARPRGLREMPRTTPCPRRMAHRRGPPAGRAPRSRAAARTGAGKPASVPVRYFPAPSTPPNPL